MRAAASEQDGVIFLTAAFTGLRRGELGALRWRDIDFAMSSIRVEGSFSDGELTTPKSGRGRVVPMVPEVGTVLARLSQRDTGTGDDDLVFLGENGTYLDGSALRRRFESATERAGLRPIRFHDLRHTFGTLREQQDAAERLAKAFAVDPASRRHRGRGACVVTAR